MKMGTQTAHLRAALSATHRDLTRAYAQFDTVTAPELVDACVYEINAVEARYNYLLRRIKEEGNE